MLSRILTIILLVICALGYAQIGSMDNPETHCTTAEERELYNMIAEYRKTNDLPVIELSRSLSYVARTHAIDLSTNRPDFGGCNPHSWSEKGKWKSCCYARDEKRLDCMTQKPRELTSYRHKAYEVVYSSGEEAKAHDAFYLWKDIGLMNDYLLNQGKWIEPWQAIGVGIFGEYACVWFGEGVDGSGSPIVCGSDTINIITNPQETVAQNVDDQLLYYIIISSTSSEEQARKEVEKVKAKGFPNALYLKNPTFFRIAVDKFSDESSAYKEMEKVKVHYPGAWLLKPNVHK